MLSFIGVGVKFVMICGRNENGAQRKISKSYSGFAVSSEYLRVYIISTGLSSESISR